LAPRESTLRRDVLIRLSCVNSEGLFKPSDGVGLGRMSVLQVSGASESFGPVGASSRPLRSIVGGQKEAKILTRAYFLFSCMIKSILSLKSGHCVRFAGGTAGGAWILGS